MTVMPTGPDSVTIRTQFSAISAGTERLVFEGRVPASQRDIMRAPFQEGAFSGPVLYGYNNVGIVEDGPETMLGNRVFTLYPHVDRFTVTASSVVRVPDAIPSSRAVLAANMETALNAIWDARPLFGERTAIIGGGVVGCLVANLAARIIGRPPVVVDINPERREIVEDLGLNFASPDDAREEFDLIFHATGQASGLSSALQMAAFEARIIELSWYGDRRVSLPLGEFFHSRRLTIQSSQVGHVAGPMRGRLSHSDRLAMALQELEDRRLDRLIDCEIAFEELPSHFDALSRGTRTPLCTIVRYDTGRTTNV